METPMTNSDEPRELAHGATGSQQPGRLFAPGLSRRRFLQATGLGAAAAAAAGIGAGPAAAAVERGAWDPEPPGPGCDL
jgi:hypothetical protein